MEQIFDRYWPLAAFIVGGIVWVRVEMAKRPTWKEASEEYQSKSVCVEKHDSVSELRKDVRALMTHFGVKREGD